MAKVVAFQEDDLPFQKARSSTISLGESLTAGKAAEGTAASAPATPNGKGAPGQLDVPPAGSPFVAAAKGSPLKAEQAGEGRQHPAGRVKRTASKVLDELRATAHSSPAGSPRRPQSDSGRVATALAPMKEGPPVGPSSADGTQSSSLAAGAATQPPAGAAATATGAAVAVASSKDAGDIFVPGTQVVAPVSVDPAAESAAAALAATERADAHARAVAEESGQMPEPAAEWPRSPQDIPSLSKASSISAASITSASSMGPVPPAGLRDVERHHSLHGEKAARRQATMELLFFASVGDPERCRVICETWGINVADRSCCDYDKRTPLHLAAAEGCYAVVQWLLYDAHAKPNAIDRFGRTPLEDAVRGDHGEVVNLLVAAGAKVRASSGALIDLQTTQLARYASNVETSYEPEASAPNWEIDPATLEIGPKVGQGEFGSVHKARWLGSTVAVKILRQADESGLGDFRTELNVLQKVHHPHTVRFFGACTKRQPYMIVTEYLPGGSLADLFKRAEYYFPSMRRAVAMALDCSKGMTYLHSHNKHIIVHRDLKPANLMLGGIPHDTGTREMAAKEGVVKIADFGLSRSLAIMQHKNAVGESMHASKRGGEELAKSNASVNSVGRTSTKDGERSSSRSNRLSAIARAASSRRYDMTGETGSYRYMAPEVFRHEPYNSKVDVYAFAMIAYELFEGRKPFGLVHPIEAARRACMDNIRPKWGPTNRFGVTVPQGLKTLVEECWAPDFEARPDFHVVSKALEAQLKELPDPAANPASVPTPQPCCALQ